MTKNSKAVPARWKWGLLAIPLIALVAAVVGLVAGTGPRPTEAAFPGANGKIAFTSERDGNAEIYVMNPDGSEQTRLTNNQALDCCPAWSPDGTKIAFTSNRDARDGFVWYEIYVMNADGSGQTNLTNHPAFDENPTWSPDGLRIAFTRREVGDIHEDIYVMNADGGDQRPLTSSPARDLFPSWSPDGSQIAFATNRDGNDEIYVMNADGSGQTRLTDNPARDSDPAWSPDGSQIAFAFDALFAEIHVTGRDGGIHVDLANSPGRESGPAWSPDGSQIALTSSRDRNADIYILNVDGGGYRRLTYDFAMDARPDWQPLAAFPDTGAGSTGSGAWSALRWLIAALAGAAAITLGGAAWWARRKRA